MSPVHAERLKHIIEAALKLDEPERSALLEEACRQDPALRTSLQQLLDATGPSQDFLPDPLTLPAGRSDRPLQTERASFRGTPDFEILRRIGTGGSSEVFEAFDRKLGVRVALKVLRDLHPDQVERFKQGWRSVSSRIHHNLCRIYQFIFDETSCVWLLSMEFVDGERFDRYIKAAPDRLRDCFSQLASALQALHSANICHGDVKPSNVLITPEGRVVVLDFGLSSRLDLHHSPTRSTVALTPRYAAPELFKGKQPSAASDWYSVGVMLDSALDNTAEIEIGDLADLREGLLRPDPDARPNDDAVLAVLCPSSVRLALPSAASTFIGRRKHVEEVSRLFREQVLVGRFGLVHVRGQSGIGKTAFVEESLRRLAEFEPDLKLVAGRCYHGESVPYKAVDEVAAGLASLIETLGPAEARSLLSPQARWLSYLFPIFDRLAKRLRITTPEDEPAIEKHEIRRRAFSAFSGLLVELGKLFRLCIFIDDTQWGDLDSSNLLHELTHTAPPLLLILACRGEGGDAQPEGLELLDIEGQLSVQLGPLSPEESADLAQAILGSNCTMDELQQIASDSLGNPFFIRQLAEYRIMGGQSQLEKVIQDRASTLSVLERRSLEVLSVARAPLGLAVLREVAELGEDVRFVHAGLNMGCLIRTLGTPDEAVLPYHDRIAEAVSETISADRRMVVHRRIASALETSGNPDSERIAIHYYQGGAIREACRLGQLAADRSSSTLAFERAASLYKTVVAWAREDESVLHEMDLGRLEASHGDALVNCGRGVEAARTFERAIPLVPAVEAMSLRIRSASELLRAGEIASGLAILEGLLRQHGIPFPANRTRAIARLLWENLRLKFMLWRSRKSLLHLSGEISALSDEQRARFDVCWAAATGISMVYPLLAEIYFAIYLKLALQRGERRHLALALASYASRQAYIDDGENRDAHQLMETAKELARQDGGPYVRALAEGMSATIHGLTGDWQTCLDQAICSEAAFRTGCVGVAWEIATVSTYLFTARTMLGDWNENATRIAEYVGWARGRGDLYADVTVNLVSATYAQHLANDRPDLAKIAISECLAKWPSASEIDIQKLYAFQGLINLDLYSGDAKSAWNRVERDWPAVQRSGLLRLTLLQTFLEDARGRAALSMAICSARRERQRLIKIVIRSIARLRRSRARYAPGLAHMLEGGIAVISRAAAEATYHLEQAEAVFESERLVPWLAVARMAQAECLTGGDKARKWSAGLEWMHSQRIQKPERLAGMLFPAGFDSR